MLTEDELRRILREYGYSVLSSWKGGYTEAFEKAVKEIMLLIHSTVTEQAVLSQGKEMIIERMAGVLCSQCFAEDNACDYAEEQRPCDHARIPSIQLYSEIAPAIKAEGIKEYKDVLEVARTAILDTVYCEDGLDGGAADAVMKWITDVLGDEKEWKPTIEGFSNQSKILYKKAFNRQSLKSEYLEDGK